MSVRSTEALAQRIEQADGLDGPAERVAALARPALGAPTAKHVLSGSWMGHPLHPALVATPIGFWGAASVMDLTGDRRAARRLVGLGLLTAVPAAAAGMADWLDTSGAERRVGVAHMLANTAGLSAYLASWLARRRGHHLRGGALSLLGLVAAGSGGWLGGHLSYALGVGVDTNAFDAGPAEWTRLDADPPSDGQPVSAVAGSTRVMATRQPDGVRVLADRCSHRGGPLSEGRVADGCVTCPWHGSRFDVRSGEVRQGPATVAQPVYEVSESAEGIRVRRNEVRALRSNSVKP